MGWKFLLYILQEGYIDEMCNCFGKTKCSTNARSWLSSSALVVDNSVCRKLALSCHLQGIPGGAYVIGVTEGETASFLFNPVSTCEKHFIHSQFYGFSSRSEEIEFLSTIFFLWFFFLWKRGKVWVLCKFLLASAEHLDIVPEQINNSDMSRLESLLGWAKDYLGHHSMSHLQVLMDIRLPMAFD